MEGHLPKFICRIAFVKRGQEDIWRKYWLRPTEVSANARSANREGALSRTDLVEAASFEEALALVQGRHSNCSVMPEGSEKVV
jgi:hypothetical protein